jgi:hypothetical protein
MNMQTVYAWVGVGQGNSNTKGVGLDNWVGASKSRACICSLQRPTNLVWPHLTSSIIDHQPHVLLLKLTTH